MSCCKTCYKLCNPIADCLSTLSVMTTETDQALKAIITDKFGHKYSKSVTSASNGLIVIDFTDEDSFPESLLNQWAGEFTLTVEKNTVIVPFTIEGLDYDCLTFKVAHHEPKESNYLIDVYNTGNSREYN